MEIVKMIFKDCAKIMGALFLMDLLIFLYVRYGFGFPDWLFFSNEIYNDLQGMEFVTASIRQSFKVALPAYMAVKVFFFFWIINKNKSANGYEIWVKVLEVHNV